MIYNVNSFFKNILKKSKILKASSLFKVAVFSMIIIPYNHKSNIECNDDKEHYYNKLEPERTGHIGEVFKTA